MILKHKSHLISKIILWDKHYYSNVRADRVAESRQLTQVHTAIELLNLYLNLGLSDAIDLSTESCGWLLITDPAYFWNTEGSVSRGLLLWKAMAWFHEDEAVFAEWVGTLALAMPWHGFGYQFCPLNRWVPFSKFINFSSSVSLSDKWEC